jgi:predicted GTPase
LRDTFARYPSLGPVLPAMGYGRKQILELEDTIRRVPCDAVIIATPVDLGRVLTITQPTCRVAYDIQECGPVTLRQALGGFVEAARSHG